MLLGAILLLRYVAPKGTYLAGQDSEQVKNRQKSAKVIKVWPPMWASSRAPGRSENLKYLIYKWSLTLFHFQSQFFNLIFSHAVSLEWRNCTAITDAWTAILIHLYYDSPLILPSDVTQLLGIPQLKFPLESKSI